MNPENKAAGEPKGLVTNIMRFAVNDGPGIRTTVFLKGCPLACIWCHNPESISTKKELLIREERCLRCGDCFKACPHGAIAREDGRFVTSREACLQCGTCLEACAAEARALAGREMDVHQVISEVQRDAVFYEESGGGVTFSGGEPFLQHGFLLALLQACRREGLRTAVDTAGYVSPEILKLAGEQADLFLYDLKTTDDARHREFTGVSNRLILENLTALSSQGRNIIVRIPVIPGFNDDLESIRAIGRFVSSLGRVREVHLLPYHASGAEKVARLGRAFKMAGTVPPPAERLELLADALRRLSLEVTIGG